MRPCASVSGTRCTRCTPDSNLSLAKAPRPRISATISLKPPLVPSLAAIDLGLPALPRGIALVHAEQVAGEQRRLVAAGAGADFEDDVALVHRVLGQQREPELLDQPLALAPRAPAARRRAISRISASVLGSAISASRSASSAGDLAIGLDLRHHRIELGEFARQLDELLRRQLARQLGLDHGVAGEQRVELALGQRGHSCSPSAAANASSRSRIAMPGRLLDQRAQQRLGLLGVEIEQHRLDRAERRRRQRQRAIAERHQRQRADRLGGQLAAQRHRLAGGAALVDDRPSARAAPAPRSDRSGRRPGGCRGRRRNRNCTRSLEPTERKSTRGISSSSWNSSDGTSTMAPTSTRSGSLWRRRRSASARARPAPWPRRIRRPSRPSGT